MCAADHLVTVGAVMLVGPLGVWEPNEVVLCCVMRAQDDSL